MTMFILQTVLLVLIAFILGCVIGSLLRHLFGGKAEAVSQPSKKAEPAKKSAVPQAAKEEPKSQAAAQKPLAEPAEKPAESDTSATNPEDAVRQKEEAVEKPKPAKVAPKTSQQPPVTVPSQPDDLKRIKGVGKLIEGKLNDAGITNFAQIAAWSESEVSEFSEKLSFKGRIERENWVEQAKALVDEQSGADAKPEGSSSAKEEANPSEVGKPDLLDQPDKSGADDLTLIEGIGSVLEQKLNQLGIYHYSQIARWDEDNQNWIGAQLGFPGRPQRENWVEAAEAYVANPPASKSSSKTLSGRKAKIT